MIFEKVIFILLCAIGIVYNPISMVSAFFVLSYIVLKELKAGKDEYKNLKDVFSQELNKCNEDLSKTLSEVQKLKDSIISLKMDRGINKAMR